MVVSPPSGALLCRRPRSSRAAPHYPLVEFFGNPTTFNHSLSPSSAAYILSLVQSELSCGLVLTSKQDCSLLVQLYALSVRSLAHRRDSGLIPDLRVASEVSCRVILSAAEACLAWASKYPALRVPTALALLKSQTLECLAQLIRVDIEGLCINGQQEQLTEHHQGQEEQQQLHHQGAGQPAAGLGQSLKEEDPTTATHPTYVNPHRLRLYHSLDEAACLVGWVVDTLQQTKGKRSSCICELCMGWFGQGDDLKTVESRVARLAAVKTWREGPPEDEDLTGQHDGAGEQEEGGEGGDQGQGHGVCLVDQLWRALSRSRLVEAIVEGLLCLRRTAPSGQADSGGAGGEDDECGDGGRRAGSVMAAARRAYADEMRLAGAAGREFSLRPGRRTLSHNLGWMPHGLELCGFAEMASVKRALECMRGLGSQLALAGGVVAAACAAGVSPSYGLAPGPLVALAGDVLPCLWECGTGAEAAVDSSKQLLWLLHRRLEALASHVRREKRGQRQTTLRGLVRVYRGLAAALMDRAKADDSKYGSSRLDKGQPPPPPPEQQQQQALQQHHGRKVEGSQAQEGPSGRELAGQGTGAHGGAGTPMPCWSGTWLCHVPRAAAVYYAAHTLRNLARIMLELPGRRGPGAAPGAGGEGGGHWKPLWWWRQAVELLPLLVVNEAHVRDLEPEREKREKQGGKRRAQLPEDEGSWQPLSGTFYNHNFVEGFLEKGHALTSRTLDLTITDAANALAAGLLPALERLLRKGPGQVAARGEATEARAAEWLVGCFLDRMDWLLILPYADTRHVAGVMSAAAHVFRRRRDEMESAGGRPLTESFKRAYRAACRLTGLFKAILGDELRDALCCPGGEGEWIAALHTGGPLACCCERAACALCRPTDPHDGEWRRHGSSCHGSGGRGSGGGSCHGSSSGGSGGGSGGGGGGGNGRGGHSSSSGSGGGRGDGGCTSGSADSGESSVGPGGQRQPGPWCPARRLAVNASLVVWELLPLMARAVLVAEQHAAERGKADKLYSHDLLPALTAVCLRVQAEANQEQQQQQQQEGAREPGVTAPTGGRATAGGRGSSVQNASRASEAASARHGCPTTQTTEDAAASGAAAAGARPSSWCELVLSLQPLRLLKLGILESSAKRVGRSVLCALSALALAVPEHFAAALQADPELTDCIAQRVKGSGGKGSEPDEELADVLQQVLPALPPCKAVEVLEGRCGLPVVSRAKRQAARDRLQRARGARAGVWVLVSVEEVQVALAGCRGAS